MKWNNFALALAVVIGCTSTAGAVDFGLLLSLTKCWPDCVKQTCCDDYCPKSMPCVPQVKCFGCDDYRPKCEPVVKKVCCFGCDDYCSKCEPVIKCAPPTMLRCIPLNGGGTPGGCGKTSQGQGNGSSSR